MDSNTDRVVEDRATANKNGRPRHRGIMGTERWMTETSSSGMQCKYNVNEYGDVCGYGYEHARGTMLGGVG